MAANQQKFRTEYSKKWAFIQTSRRGDSYAFCNSCNCDINISHAGAYDIEKHMKTKKHIDFSQAASSSRRLSSFFGRDEEQNQVIRAEVLFSNFLVEHNLPLAAADHATDLFPKMFPDSGIAKKYSSKRTKTTAIVRSMAADTKGKYTQRMREQPFSLSVDGGNNQDYSGNLYPLVISVYNSDQGLITPVLVSLRQGSDSSGKGIFTLLDGELTKRDVTWGNCMSLGCDNASVMTGIHKGVAAFVKKKVPGVFIAGCPCHLVNLAAQKAAEKLPMAVDELLIDVYYYLDKSSKRKKNLGDKQIKCGSHPVKILKHCNTRWLSLGICIKRLLAQYEPLTDFFKEECKTIASKTVKTVGTTCLKRKAEGSNDPPCAAKKVNSSSTVSSCPTSKSIATGASTSTQAQSTKAKPAPAKPTPSTSSAGKKPSGQKPTEASKLKQITESRAQRVKRLLVSPQTKLYCCFLDEILPVFDGLNTYLQNEAPLIHRLRRELNSLLKNLLVRFVKPAVIRKSENVCEVNFTLKFNQKENSELVVGAQVRKFIDAETKSEENPTGRLTKSDLATFYSAVRLYCETACQYIATKFPLNDELLLHAEVVDLELRDEKTFASLAYFINRFSCLLPDSSQLSQLEQEFAYFQADTLTPEVLSMDRIDAQWHELGKVTSSNGTHVYGVLAFVMLGILVLPHSNATCERIFSMVRKNQTDFRPNLQVETLEALLVQKSAMNEPCHRFKPSKQLLQKAKQATYQSLRH